jgi:hypothetical protein
MANQRRVPNSPKKDERSSEGGASSSWSGKSKGKDAEKGTSPLLVMGIGFILLIAYTVWSSIQTYGNALHSDME